MESLRVRVETWIREQAAQVAAATWSVRSLPWHSLPASLPAAWQGAMGRREQERALKKAFERRQKKLRELCAAVKADSVADLQEVLNSMVLSECVYKKPASEMIKFINKFKLDFGGEIVSLEWVQPSLDHVPHRYLLAEAGDTLFASFIGTKQYKDVIADANILQGAIFHEDVQDFDMVDIELNDMDGSQNKADGKLGKPIHDRRRLRKSKPAAHKGFLARAKGIPALELYNLARKKKRNLVLCGHSLGGAVAALATLAILRAVASSSESKEHVKLQVKCITFSQPPVGNAALRDYVNQKGWRDYFKTYCMPEDLVPRILSPAYFHHYNAQIPRTSNGNYGLKPKDDPKKQNVRESTGREQPTLLPMGQIQTSLWRLSKLIPLAGVRNNLIALKGHASKFAGETSKNLSSLPSMVGQPAADAFALQNQEGSKGISLPPFLDAETNNSESSTLNNISRSVGTERSRKWRRMPSLPSYVPFGQLYLLGDLSVKFLSDSEYSKLTSVKSVIAEVKECFRSHSMRSYRSRFQKICDAFLSTNANTYSGMEQSSQFSHLHQLLGFGAFNSVKLGAIVEPPVIQTATTIVPLGWSGIPGDKEAEPLKVDIVGHGLHSCTVIQARLNGRWLSTTIERPPSTPPNSSYREAQPTLQKMRILVGAPLRQTPKHDVQEGLGVAECSSYTECVTSTPEHLGESFFASCKIHSEGLDDFLIYCTGDFVTTCKKVHHRTRMVRMIGLEGSGKTSLLRAMLFQARHRKGPHREAIPWHADHQEVVEGGLCFVDSKGMSLQTLHQEVARFKQELQTGTIDPNRKTDLIVLVHNLAHEIPMLNGSRSQPVLSLFLNEARALGVPWVLVLSNKLSISPPQRNLLISNAMETYRASPDMTKVIDSCPSIAENAANSFGSHDFSDQFLASRNAPSKNAFSHLSHALVPQQKKETMSVSGIGDFRELVHNVLRNNEEKVLEDFAEQRLSIERARERQSIAKSLQKPKKNGSSVTASAVGASLGAGLGLVMAIVMGAASALRKP